VAGIGIAGENQIIFANILCDHGRVAGRTGLGAVMGSKNLKAIAVKGSGEIPVFNANLYNDLRSKLNKELKNDNLAITLRELGTAGGMDYFDYLGSLPKKYFSAGSIKDVDKISGASISENYSAGVSACHACVVACGRVVQRNRAEEKQKGPEYETLAGFGPNLGITDPEYIFIINELCDRFGIDTISTSGVIGFAISLYQEGILSPEDTGGMILDWGDKKVIRELVELIASKKGFGKKLALGAREMGRGFGALDLAIQVNGLEVPYHDPRGISGMALVYSTSPRGACHNQSDYYLAEIGQVEEELGMKFFGRHVGEEKVPNVVIHQNWRTVFNSLVMCIFGNISPNQLLDLIKTGCGYSWTIEQLLLTGERGWNIKRVINNRLGLRREQDILPKPLLKLLPDGGAAGFVIPFDSMLDAYYLARSWDMDTGFPSKEKLIGLDLDFVINDLWG
jgi:aldehyde:ferredoxin oxidoreductase